MVQTTKTYTPLSQIPAVKVRTCAAILPNKMQCWRAGDVQVVRQTTTPKTENSDETVEKVEYQLCYRHTQIEQQQDEIEAAKQVEQKQPEKPVQKQITQVEKKPV